ncbi:MAG: peptidylprolyl isomerase, partial [Desulfovibrionaceae bacterium]|nr:peptidylprolyl isomerase [Desulfovibrionaceae bacterium]
DQELKDAEDLIRADYPDGAFEQVLIEEYIDLNSWRRQLKYKLALDKFTQMVLRPHIKIDYKEAQDYYRKHIAEFYLPERIKILVVNGPSKELVNRAVQILQRDNNATLDSEDLKQVSAREIVASRERLSEQWQKALLGVGQGQATRILSDENRFERLVLLERHPARLLDPSQAYPLVEEALLDHKLQKAFEDWLARALEDAVVSISEQLLPGAEEADPGQAQGQAQEQVPDQVREEVQEGPREPALEELQEQAPEQAQEQAEEPPSGEVQDESNAAPGQ